MAPSAPSAADPQTAAAGTTAAAAPDPRAQAGSAPCTPLELSKALHNAAAESRAKWEFYRRALRLFAGQFNAVYAAIEIEGSAGTQQDAVRHGTSADEQWKQIAQALLLDVRFRNQSRVRFFETAAGLRFATMALPLNDQARGTVGSLVIIAPCPDPAKGTALLTQLTAWVSLGVVLAGQIGNPAPLAATPGPARAAGHAPDLRGTDKAAAHENLHHYAFSIVNGLKTKLGCEQVSLGRVRGNTVQVLCTSGTDDVYSRSPGIRQIQQAMAECLDAGAPVVYQHSPTHSPEETGLRLLVHKQWHESVGRAAVASIPLRHQGQIAAVLSLRGAGQQVFGGAEIKKLQELTATLAPGIVLLERAGRTLPQHLRDEVRRRAALLAGSSRARRLALAVLVAATAWLAVGHMEYVVTTPCELVAGEQRQLAAPFEAAIQTVHVRPGDEVQSGQLLVELDTRELALERDQLQAERDLAELQVTRALSVHDTATAGEARATLGMIAARMQLVQFKLDRARIVAPVAGVVLDGRLAERVGEVVPLGEPLVVVAPTQSLELELRVPEHAAPLLAPGQSGQFATLARPDYTAVLHLRSVDPKSAVHDGKNVFVARAALRDAPAWFRSGMRGVAQVNAGSKPAGWTLVHRVLDKIRLWWWQL